MTKTTGILKKSLPNTPLEFMLKLHAYQNARQYKDKEFPQPLQARRFKR